MTRKEFLARASALFGTLTVTSLSGSPASGSPVHGRGKVEALNKLVSERHKARWRFRRIILNILFKLFLFRKRRFKFYIIPFKSFMN